ncbi:ADP-ribosylglycohydrolase family protein [Chitinophaga silvatica]|nr:ADP-ribosylglycohydrolase family protein [Chitinophaga silvatica]
MINNFKDKLLGCLVGGAVGDAVGSYYESQSTIKEVSYEHIYGITDDTQLTLATCEAIISNKYLTPDKVAQHLLQWYNKGLLRGLGASTLKALRDLQMGAHWGLSGRGGEYAAGNGAAMRIAPLAFVLNVPEQRQLIRDICYITHKNEEAYVGALSILYVLHYTLNDVEQDKLMNKVISEIPDTQVRDNLISIAKEEYSIQEAAKLLGTSGFVAASVPFSIYASQQVSKIGFQNVITQIIKCGGDTDTNASLAGQIMGTTIGYNALPTEIISIFNKIPESSYIIKVANNIEPKI